MQNSKKLNETFMKNEHEGGLKKKNILTFLVMNHTLGTFWFELFSGKFIFSMSRTEGKLIKLLFCKEAI